MRSNGFTGLANLLGVSQPAFVDSGTGACYCGIFKESSQLFQHVEFLLAAEATAACCDHISFINLNSVFTAQSFFFYQFNTAYSACFRSEGNNLTGAGVIQFSRFEYFRTNGTHLRTVNVADDGSADIAAQCGTSPSNELIIGYIQSGTVSAQAGMQTCCNTRSQVTAVIGSTEHNRSRIIFLRQLADSIGI